MGVFRDRLRNFKQKCIEYYRNRYMPQYRWYDPVIAGVDENVASNMIYELLNSEKPCMVSRFGATELICTENYRKGGHPFWFFRKLFPFWVDKSVIANMEVLSGFISPTKKNLCAFADLELESARKTDILGTWIWNERLFDKEMSYKKVQLGHLNPFYAKDPWSRILEGKKVLVVHPFAESIKKQYERRHLLFPDRRVLPTMNSLHVIKAVQTIGGQNQGFSSWFDALHYMEDQIDAVDYDIALIGCGAYGMPLAAHCKDMGKKAVHLGGALQLLFGIKGRRWEEEYKSDKVLSDLMRNPYWVRPSIEETPTAANKIENGCYW